MLSLIEVHPNDKLWKIYLEISAKYFLENWPEDFPHNLQKIQDEYSVTLKDRLKEGGRGLFLFCNNGKKCGVTNVYLTNEKDTKILNIAEFYIQPKMRRQKLGSKYYELILDWAKKWCIKSENRSLL